MAKTEVIDVGERFSRFPAGRIRTDGPFSGQRFREDFLVPALSDGGCVLVKLDSALGFGSSFLEEAFAGLVREHGFDPADLLQRLELEARDKSLIAEIREYIASACN